MESLVIFAFLSIVSGIHANGFQVTVPKGTDPMHLVEDILAKLNTHNHAIEGHQTHRNCTTMGCMNGRCMGSPPRCACHPGFTLSRNPSVCLDIDECYNPHSPTRSNDRICGYGRCVNQPGSYFCVCHDDGVPLGPRFCMYHPRPRPYPRQQPMPEQRNTLSDLFYYTMMAEMF